MDIKKKRETIEKFCESNQCGFVNYEVLHSDNLSAFSKGIYAILVSMHNGNCSYAELMEQQVGFDEDVMYAVWALFKNGFICLNTMSDNEVENIYETFWADKTMTMNGERKAAFDNHGE